MSMDVGLHWHLDDPTSVINPTILGMAAEINLGAWEGVIYNRLGAPPKPVNDYRFEIYDRSRTLLTGTVGNGSGTGWANGTATTSLPLPAASIAMVTVGDVLEIKETNPEQVVVKAVDRSGNTIDVWERGRGGSTAASHADTTAFTVIGKAVNDSDAKNVEAFAEQSGKYTNYTQTVFELINQTYTDTISARKDFEENPQLIKEALDRVFRKLTKTAIKGRQSVGTKTSPQTTSGILHQLSNGGGVRTPLRYNASGVTSPEAILKSALQTVWNTGGDPTHIYLSPTNKRKFDPLTEQFIKMSRAEAGVIGTDNGTAYMYQNKTLPFIQDQDMPDDRICIVTEASIYKGWRVGDMLRGPVQEPLLSSRELKYSIQGSFFIQVYGVGIQHIDIYNVAI